MASDFTYQFTDKARTDLDDAVSYMAVTLGSPASAKAFIDKIEEAIEDLCMFPKRGPAVFNEYIRISGIRKKQSVII